MVKFVLPLAASAIFILVAAFTLLSGREAVAESSELSLFPMMPLPGETIAVLYRPTAKFSQDEHLILRAEVAFRDSIETRQVEIGHIFRVGDEFRGQFEFPSAADFAAIGIASADGQRLDLDNREWLLVASNPSGQPTRTGLMGKVAFTRQWAGDIAEETLLMVTELYPDSAGGWSQLQQTEAYFSSQTERDSINERHRTILHRLDRRLADQPLSASQIADMVFYARGLDDQIRDRWFDRLLREYPNAPPTSWHKVFEARDRLRDDPEKLLEAFDQQWDAEGDPHGQLSLTAFGVARLLEDPEAVLRWGERLESRIPRARFLVAHGLSSFPDLVDPAADRLAKLIHELASVSIADRPFHQTAEEARAENLASQAHLYVALGRIELTRGNSAEALQHLHRASTALWDPTIFRSAAEAALELGDSSVATHFLARLAVDPSTAISGSVLEDYGFVQGDSAWSAHLGRAQAERDEATRRLIINRPLRGELALRSPTGDEVRFAGRFEGTTVIGMWSRYCNPSVLQLDAWGDVVHLLEAQGTRVVSITDEAPSGTAEAFFQDRTNGLSSLYDPDHTAATVLDNFALPRYYVVDSSGHIRYETNSPEHILRVVAYLTDP